MPDNSVSGFMQLLPFRRHWPAILIILALASVMSIPLFSLNLNYSQMNDMFDLTSFLFSLFWGLGWSAGILIMVCLAFLLLFARERVIVEPASITIRIEALGFGAQARYEHRYISHLRYITDRTIPGADWRKRHLTFDYLGNPVSLGFDLDQPEAAALCQKINATLSSPIPIRPTFDPDALGKAAERAAEQAQAQLQDSDRANIPSQPTDSPETGRLSRFLLIFSNLFPLFGALFFGWQISDLMLLFWLESAIIGFFNILKMAKIDGIAAIFSIVFFIGHFGVFMSVHLMFVFALFFEDADTRGIMTLAQAADLFLHMWPAILALVVSHGFSFVENFLGRKEYLSMTLEKQMQKPYSRVVLMHLTLIIGGFMVKAFGSALLPLVLLITLKIIVDINAHKREHKTGTD